MITPYAISLPLRCYVYCRAPLTLPLMPPCALAMLLYAAFAYAIDADFRLISCCYFAAAAV